MQVGFSRFNSVAPFFRRSIFSPQKIPFTPYCNRNFVSFGSIRERVRIIALQKEIFLQTILRNAIQTNNTAFAKFAIYAGAPINRQDKEDPYDYPIVRAAYNRANEIADLLIEAGADVNKTCFHGHTPLLAASARGNTGLVKSLLLARAEVNIADREGHTALMEACGSMEIETATTLLNGGADPHLADKKGNNSLLHAIKSSFYEIGVTCGFEDEAILPFVEKLIGLSKIDAADYEGNTPLMVAVAKGYFPIIKLLLKANPDKSIVNQSGQTALSIATTQLERREKLAESYLTIIEILKNADTSRPTSPKKSQDNNMFELITFFNNIHKNNIDKVARFIEEGNDVNQPDSYFNETPLIRAARKGNIEIVKLLIDAGANTLIKNIRNDTALDEAMWGYEDNLKTIERYHEVLTMMKMNDEQLKAYDEMCRLFQLPKE